jgi:hypothetical protein
MRSNTEQCTVMRSRRNKRGAQHYLGVFEDLGVGTRYFPRVMLTVHENPGLYLVPGGLVQVVICLTRVGKLRMGVSSLLLTVLL